MSQIAIYSGNIAIYWNSVVIVLGIVVGFLLSLGLYTSAGGRGGALLVVLPLALLLSVFFSRVIHWYCHMEQYASFLGALTDFSVGSYSLPGMLLGVGLAVGLAKLMGFCRSAALMLDSLAPGMALSIAMIRLSALFDNTCRSKIIISDPALQHLPLASELTSASGVTEFRFATFFVEFLVMLIVTAVLLSFFLKRRALPLKDGSQPTGNTARMFLLLFSAVELVLDSTRYDSSFFHFTFLKGLNPYVGFVSLIQMIAAISIICLLVHYSKHSIRGNSLRAYHWLCWILFLLSLGGVGASEYLVQRHGDWYMYCYPAMALCSVFLVLIVRRLYLSGLQRRRPRPQR